jgi:DNA-binding transcriptional MerR regulator
VAGPPHLSIGEVLSLLRAEFPEVTISKIRFLESQGLIAPERTPSGYRKFYDTDVERLRWILQQQKDHYLPLKVIREKLDDGPGASDEHDAGPGGAREAEDGSSDGAASGRLDLAPPPPAAVTDAFHAAAGAAATRPSPARAPGEVEEAAPGRATRESRGVRERGGAAREDGATADAEPIRPGGGPATSRGAAADTVDVAADAAEAADAADEAATVGDTDAFGGAAVTNRFTRGELARRSGLKETEIRELEAHGLLPRPADEADAGVFDDDALAVAHLARSFARHGIEPRHLKMYKHFAEREATLYESVVMPLLRQRNPQARRQAQEVVAELARLGRALRTAMLRSSLQGPFGD